jgi:hypothetical protein
VLDSSAFRWRRPDHTISITVTSSTGSVPIVGLGSSPMKGYAGQASVYSAGVPFEASDTLSSTTAAYNADANLISGDGGAVTFVNVRAYWCPNCASVAAGSSGISDRRSFSMTPIMIFY